MNMKNFELVSGNSEENNSQWDSLANWVDEVEDKKVKRKEAFDSYRAASEAFRMDFNKRATGPEQFAEWIASEEDGISEEEIEFEGKTIKVYHLTGHEFLALVHCIDYRGSKADKIIYPEVYEKSKAIRDDPSNWKTVASENNPQNISNGLAKTSSANNISSSLVSNKVPDGHWGDSEEAIYYGFSNIGHRGIIKAGRGDMGVHQGWTSNIEDEADVRPIQTIDIIEESNGPNEVAFNRYEEDNGHSLSPSFIYCPNGIKTVDDLTNAQKHHAAYFNVPIVILHKEAYDKNQK